MFDVSKLKEGRKYELAGRGVFTLKKLVPNRHEFVNDAGETIVNDGRGVVKAVGGEKVGDNPKPQHNPGVGGPKENGGKNESGPAEKSGE